MVVFEDFIEIIYFVNFLSKPCAHRTHNVVWAWHTSKFYLIHTTTLLSMLELVAVSKAMPSSKVSLLESVPCGFGSMSIDALACENFRWNNFENGWNSWNPQKFSARYTVYSGFCLWNRSFVKNSFAWKISWATTGYFCLPARVRFAGDNIWNRYTYSHWRVFR